MLPPCCGHPRQRLSRTFQIREIHVTFDNLSKPGKPKSAVNNSDILPLDLSDVVVPSVAEKPMHRKLTPLDCSFVRASLKGMFNLLPKKLRRR